MLIQFSPAFIPTGSSASVPWPMCAPKFRTPGIFSSSALPCLVMRTISPCEVPGRPTQCLAKPPDDVLDVDDGVIDYHSQRDHESGQHHRVDGGAGRREDEPGGD